MDHKKRTIKKDTKEMDNENIDNEKQKKENIFSGDKDISKINHLASLFDFCYEHDIQSLIIVTLKIDRIYPENCEFGLASFFGSFEQRKIILDFTREIFTRELNDPSIYITSQIKEDKKTFLSFFESYVNLVSEKDFQYFFAYILDERQVCTLYDCIPRVSSKKSIIKKYKNEIDKKLKEVQKLNRNINKRFSYTSKNNQSLLNVISELFDFLTKKDSLMFFLFYGIGKSTFVNVTILSYGPSFERDVPENVYLRIRELYAEKYNELFPENSLIYKLNLSQRSLIFYHILHCILHNNTSFYIISLDKKHASLYTFSMKKEKITTFLNQAFEEIMKEN